MLNMVVGRWNGYTHCRFDDRKYIRREISPERNNGRQNPWKGIDSFDCRQFYEDWNEDILYCPWITIGSLATEIRYHGTCPQIWNTLKITTGHPVIMGRNCFESIGRPLPNRTNIVVSRDAFYSFFLHRGAINWGSAADRSQAPGRRSIHHWWRTTMHRRSTFGSGCTTLVDCPCTGDVFSRNQLWWMDVLLRWGGCQRR